MWGNSPAQPFSGSGERRELTSRVCLKPRRKRILEYFEGHKTLLFTPAYADALSSSNTVSCHIWGGKAEVPPYRLRTAHVKRHGAC